MQKYLFFILISLVLSTNPNLPQHTLKIYGNASLGYYYIKIYVGHPPQQQTVIIDTGSGQLAIPCNKCTQCNSNHINRPFDMSKSKTAEYVTCQSDDPQCKRCLNKAPFQSCKFSISYAQGSSLQGIIIKDSIQFQSFSQGQQIITSFGCTNRETNLFLKQQANGIFGLAPQRTSNLLVQLYKKHHDYSGQQFQFSLCLSGNGGQMSIGGINKQIKNTSQPIKVSYSPHKNLYSINNVKEITIGKTVIHEQNEKFGYYGIFIDSGSTFTYFPKNNFQSFKQQLLKNCKQHESECQIASGQSTQCFHLKGLQDIIQLTQKIFKPIIINVENQKLFWQPSKYFLLRDISNRQICLGVQALDRYLLGANWMIDRNIVFNLHQNSIKIYSNVNCQKTQSKDKQIYRYTEQITGHKPLTYESINFSKINISYPLKLTFGIILTFIGSIGLVILLTNRPSRQQIQKHQPVSQTQTEQNLQQNNI